MYIRTREETIDLKPDIFYKYDMENMAYFDIETTGFDKEKDCIMLISLGWFSKKNTFCVKQYFAESLEEEKSILIQFKEDIEGFNTWCSYNGKAFDEPYIKIKLEKYNINCIIPDNHVDLYRMIRPYYRKLGIERCNLKTVEKFIGIQREDLIDGGISIELYYKYLQEHGEELKETIMLHNFEDVLNLPKLFEIVSKIDEGDLRRDDIITEKQYKYLQYLIKKNNIEIPCNVEKISKKSAGKVIDCLLRGNIDVEELMAIIKNSY